MTVTTRIAVAAPVPVEQVWTLAARLVDAPDSYRFEDTADVVGPGTRTRRAAPGQGCRALLWMHWAVDGPIGPQYWNWDADGADPPPEVARVCYVVCVDTPNGHRTARGGRPRDLHAWFALHLAEQLGVPCWVQDEYSRAWHPCTPAGVAALGDPDDGAPWGPADGRRR